MTSGTDVACEAWQEGGDMCRSETGAGVCVGVAAGCTQGSVHPVRSLCM